MSSALLLHWILKPALLAGLAAFAFLRLRSAKYDVTISVLLCGLTLAEPAFWDARNSLSALVFAIAVFAVVNAATSLSGRQDVRRIALLGGSLAGAQLVHPLWGAAAGLLLPVALRRRLSAENAEDLTGVYVSILFVPALTAAAIVSVDAGVRSELLSLLNIHFAMPGLLSLAPALLSCGMLVISLVLRPWNASASVIVALGFALMAVCVVFSSMALQVEPVAAAFGILALGLVCSWPVSGARRPLALLPVFGIAVCMWTPFWLGHAHV